MKDEQLIEYLKKRRAEQDKAAMIGSIAPLAIGLLSGRPGAGAEVAAQTIGQRVKQSGEEDRSLLSSLMKRETSTLSGAKTIVGPDGKLMYVKTADAIGKEAPRRRQSVEEYSTKRDIMAKSKRSLGVGKVLSKDHLGNVVIVDKGTDSTVDIKGIRKRRGKIGDNPVERKRFDDLAKGFDTKTKYIQTAVPKMHEVMAKLNNPSNLFASKEAIRKLITAIEPRLTDKDAVYYTAAQSTVAKLREMLESEVSGQIPQRLIDEAKESVTQTMSMLNQVYEKTKINEAGAASNDDREVFDAIFKRFKGSDPIVPKTKQRAEKKAVKRADKLRSAAKKGNLSKDAQGNYYINGKLVK